MLLSLNPLMTIMSLEVSLVSEEQWGRGWGEGRRIKEEKKKGRKKGRKNE